MSCYRSPSHQGRARDRSKATPARLTTTGRNFRLRFAAPLARQSKLGSCRAGRMVSAHRLGWFSHTAGHRCTKLGRGVREKSSSLAPYVPGENSSQFRLSGSADVLEAVSCVCYSLFMTRDESAKQSVRNDSMRFFVCFTLVTVFCVSFRSATMCQRMCTCANRTDVRMNAFLGHLWRVQNGRAAQSNTETQCPTNRIADFLYRIRSGGGT